MNTVIKRLGSKEVIKAKTVTMILGIVGAVALPQVFHLIGMLSGTGKVAGTIFLPMHVSVLIVGLLAGPVVGITAGAMSPIVSFLITSTFMGAAMPAAPMVPFMVVELAGYGLVAGLFVNKKMPLVLKVLLAQIGGRIIKGMFTLFAIHVLNNQFDSLTKIWAAVITGIPGLMIQLTFIPLFLHRIEGVKKHYE
jgi:hypothetical protein